MPTNNEAERALRKAVLWRKGTFGVNSLWLTRALQASLDGEPTPSLDSA